MALAAMQYLYCEWGWDTASVYHQLVMEAWKEGFMDLSLHVDTEENRRGDVGGALHPRFFQVALQTTGAKPRAKKGKGGAAQAKCGHCQHVGHTIAQCRKKKAEDEKGGKGSKP